MHSYRVVERWDERSLFALRCSRGRYHVARALNALPARDADLTGDKPHLGFGVLVCVGSGAVFRVIFDSINDTQVAPGDPATPGERYGSGETSGWKRRDDRAGPSWLWPVSRGERAAGKW